MKFSQYPVCSVFNSSRCQSASLDRTVVGLVDSAYDLDPIRLRCESTPPNSLGKDRRSRNFSAYLPRRSPSGSAQNTCVITLSPRPKSSSYT